MASARPTAVNNLCLRRFTAAAGGPDYGLFTAAPAVAA